MTKTSVSSIIFSHHSTLGYGGRILAKYCEDQVGERCMTEQDIAEALRKKGFLISACSFRPRGAHEASDRVYLLCVGTGKWSRIVQLIEVKQGEWHIALVTPDEGQSLAQLATASFQTGRAMPVERLLRMDQCDIWVHLGHDTHQNLRLAQL